MFWSSADKRMTYLLKISGRPGGHGIRPRSLKVTTISVIMADVAKGLENLSQLASQGDYGGGRFPRHG